MGTLLLTCKNTIDLTKILVEHTLSGHICKHSENGCKQGKYRRKDEREHSSP